MQERILLDKFKISQAVTCYLGILTDILAYSGVKVPEHILHGLSRGWLFRFGYGNEEIELSTKQMTPYDLFKMDDGIYDTKILHNLIYDIFGFQIKETLSNDIENNWQIIKNELNCGRIPIVSVYSKDLDYLPKSLRTEDGHFVAVYGYDTCKSVVSVADGLVLTMPRSIYQGDMNLESFIRAMSQRIIKEDKIRVWTTTRVKDCRELTQQDYLQALQEIIRINKLEKISILQEGYVNVGMFALEELRLTIRNIRELFDENIAQKNMESAYIGITSRGGPAASRKQMIKFLSECQHTLQIDFQPLIGTLEGLCTEWNILSSIFVRASVFLNESIVNRLLEQLQKIISLEYEAIELLGNAISV